MPDPVIKSFRHFFRYHTTYRFHVTGENLDQVGCVTVTDGSALWCVEQIAPASNSLEFDATPKPPDGLGGIGSLTITVTNTQDAGGAKATATGSAYYSGS